MENKPNRAMEILKRVPGGEKFVPVEYKKSVNAESKPAEVAVKPEEKVESKPAEVPPVVESQVEYEVEPQTEGKEEPVKNTIPKEYFPEDPTDEIDQLVDPKSPAGENFKKLRTKLKAVNSEYRKSAEELETLRTKVKEYESGLAVPEITQAQLDRIAQLEVYEKLYNFKASPVYQEKYAAPIKKAQEKLLELAKDYEVPTEALNAAIGAASAAETDRILSQYFRNPLSAIEAKGLIKSMRDVQKDALEAEKEPAKALARMQEENDRIVAERRQRANDVIVHTSKEGWSDSLVALREDARFAEITFKEGDTEHNEKYVRPILTKAAQEYGRTVRTLAEHGLTQLPKELATKLARSDQLAHYSAVLLEQRNQLQARVAELEKLVKTKSYINRPSMNGGVGASSSNGHSNGAAGPTGAARRVLERVMGSKF